MNEMEKEAKNEMNERIANSVNELVGWIEKTE